MMALARLGPVEDGTDLVPLFTRRLFTGNAWVREGAPTNTAAPPRASRACIQARSASGPWPETER